MQDDFTKGMTEEEKDLYEQVTKKFLVEKNIKIASSIGQLMSLEDLTNKGLRIAVAQDLYDNTISLCLENEQDLIICSYLGDSSKLCVNFQNKIYSISGTNNKYPPINNALWENGGGLLHPNCRHTLDPYFHGITTKEKEDSKSEIKKERENREEWLYSNRNVKKYREKYKTAKNLGLDYKKDYMRYKTWLSRRNGLPALKDSAFDMI